MTLTEGGGSNLPVHTVTIKTGATIYSKWKENKSYLMVPSGDSEFKVDYVDTRPDQTHLPTVVITHGAPGHYSNFEYLIQFLDGNNVRVIVPNFPTCPNYKPPHYRHSTEEKSAYFETFLNVLKIKRIDLIIVHSSSVYYVLETVVKKIFDIKSVALLNPGGFVMTKSLQPYWIVQMGVFVVQFPGGYSLISAASNFLLNLMDSPIDRNCVDGAILSGITMVHSGFEKKEELYRKFLQLGLPTIMAWSKNDKLIETHVSSKIAESLGVKLNKYWLYDKQGLLDQKGEEVNNIKVICFDTTSHFIFNKYPELIATEMYQHLKKVWIPEESNAH